MEAHINRLSSERAWRNHPTALKTTLDTCTGDINTGGVFISKESNHKSTISCLRFDLSKGDFEVSKDMEGQDLFFICIELYLCRTFLHSKKKTYGSLQRFIQQLKIKEEIQ